MSNLMYIPILSYSHLCSSLWMAPPQEHRAFVPTSSWPRLRHAWLEACAVRMWHCIFLRSAVTLCFSCTTLSPNRSWILSAPALFHRFSVYHSIPVSSFFRKNIVKLDSVQSQTATIFCWFWLRDVEGILVVWGQHDALWGAHGLFVNVPILVLLDIRKPPCISVFKSSNYIHKQLNLNTLRSSMNLKLLAQFDDEGVARTRQKRRGTSWNCD